jgi:hypothetical protein
MSEFEFFEGLEGAGDDGTHSAPDSLWHDVHDASTGADHNANTFTYEDAEWGPSDYDAHDTHDTPVDEGHDDIGLGEYEDTNATDEPAGLLDGLEFDLSGLDLGSLSDMQFDATYDLIGSSPGEHGWWNDLVSDHNHDGAYETISADDPYAAL